MSEKTATVKGIVLMKEDWDVPGGIKFAMVSFTLPAVGGSDTIAIANADAAIQNQRRDGKTVTLLDAVEAGSGMQAGTVFQTGTWAVSSSKLTAVLNDTTQTQAAASAGVSDVPLSVVVAYKAA